MANYYGTIFNDSLVGGYENDLMLGYAGDDTLAGGDGNDFLVGGAGNDGLWGDYGNDTLDGGDGNDTVNGWYGNESLIGGAGNDQLDANENDSVDGGAGNDTIQGGTLVSGGTGNDWLINSTNVNSTLYGGDGNDSFSTYVGNATIDGGAGTDRVDFNNRTFAESGVSKRGTVVYANGNRLTNIELLQFTDRTINVSSIVDANAPRISINDVSIAEGNSGTRNAVFTVRLDRISQQPVSVNYTIANGSAAAGTDYNAAQGTVRFNPGVINQTVSVGVKGDIILEPNETFNVNLSSPTNASISDSLGVATIINDDIALPRLSINSLSVFEGNNRNNIALTVTLTGRTSQRVSVNFATANGTATAGSDYVRTTGNVAFNASNAATQTKTIQIPIVGDSLFERDETFSVNLANAVNATLGTSRVTVTLKNDDNPPIRNSVMELSAFPSVGESKSLIMDKSSNFPEQMFAELALSDTII